ITLPPGADSAAARRRIAREEAVRIVAENREVLIVETRHGFVCANAGVDASNLPRGMLSLLPSDPDASARRVAEGLRRRTGAVVGVVISDTFGRPWRVGQTDVAIGVAGIAPLRDERGGHDRFGRPLEVSIAAVADELAGAADIVRRKAGGVPFVVVRGAEVEPDSQGSARSLLRRPDEDLFRWGLPQAVLEVLRETAGRWGLVPGAVSEETLAAALGAAEQTADGLRILPVAASRRREVIAAIAAGAALSAATTLVVVCIVDPPAAVPERDEALLAAGRAVERLRVALTALGHASVWQAAGKDAAAVAAAIALEPRTEPVGFVGIGRRQSGE
ncbi:MAG: coenzyme F420-0:L-glutamate ligase, partial [Actinomycetota bacterium]|nr:coenzyme F420-0:L-glutamate ligase [Actinomycetota bacterium]